MAAPMTSENMSNPNSDEESDETDLLSPNFNPLKALYSSRVQLPFPKATIFNNLREYERITAAGNRSDGGGSHGHGSGRGRGIEAGGGGSGGLSSSRRKKVEVPLGRGFRATEEMLIDTAKKKQTMLRNVLTRMSEFSSGPLSVLYRCMNERCKVRVCTRSFKGLRSICTGYLVTFDKFFNMALVDVDEVWRKPSTGQRFYHEEKMTFSKILKCSRTPVSEDSMQRVESRTEQAEEGDQSRKEGNTSEKGPRLSEKHHRDGTTKESPVIPKLKDRGHVGTKSSSISQGGDGRRSEKDSRRHRHKDEEEVSKSRKGEKSSHKDPVVSEEKDSKKSQESDLSEGDGDEEIEDLRQRLAALQKELTSLSDDKGESERRSPKTDVTTGDRGVTDKRLAELYKDLNSSSDDEGRVQAKEMDETVEETRTKSRETHSGDGERTVPSTASQCHQQGSTVMIEGSAEVGVQKSGQGIKGDSSKGRGDGHQKDAAHETTEQSIKALSSSTKVKQTESKDSTSASIKRGRLKIKAEEFQRRHVNQLFIRGDNVVLVSVDSILLPK
ncbi:U7 snRNA-associated Sm-like protein LSm11 isoform X2 [Patiria miniata]|uniref:LSM domain-containing protein n=1 Tax=Patiria miniata TaxID=46514 RepID=A0A914ALF0_PATMI|nr:U7 snRNA-associated Sm-like protein LSm11 isoform X2 [Patiria miniata]